MNGTEMQRFIERERKLPRFAGSRWKMLLEGQCHEIVYSFLNQTTSPSPISNTKKGLQFFEYSRSYLYL
jgi:hypothetical protein